MTGLHFLKTQKNELWIAVLRKKGNATTINELYNIPYSNWILLISAPLIVDRGSPPKSKRKRNFSKDLSKNESNN